MGSSACSWIAEIIALRSRWRESSGRIGVWMMSARMVRVCSRSGARQDAEVSVVLLPQLTPKLAPMESMVRAISSALRVWVPFGMREASRVLIPDVSGVSDGRPVSVVTVTETVGRRESRCRMRVRPLSSVRVCIASLPWFVEAVAVGSVEFSGSSEVMVSLDGMRWVLTIRWRSATVTWESCST